MLNGKKIIVVMPAYNSSKTLEWSVNAIPKEGIDEIVLVDDGSKDNTFEIATRLGLKVLRHEKNRGYGGAQKTLYKEALRLGGEVIVMVHSDFQYDPTLLPQIIKPVVEGKADASFGSRMKIKRNALKGGMPLWRFVANWGLTLVEESVLHLHISEYHSGYRAFSRAALLAIPFEENSEKYVFDTEVQAQLSMGKFKAVDIAIPTRYLKESQSPNFWKSVQYGFSTLFVLWKYLMHKFGLKKYPQFVIKRQGR